MRSNKGITMMSLIIYVTCFLLIIGVVSGITAFFYGNSNLMSQELYSAADFNKLNLYLVKESEQKGNRVTSNSTPLTFSNGDKFTFDNENELLYYNGICICEDVKDFKVNKEIGSGKEVINVKVNFTNKSYSCKYTMAQ